MRRISADREQACWFCLSMAELRPDRIMAAASAPICTVSAMPMPRGRRPSPFLHAGHRPATQKTSEVPIRRAFSDEDDDLTRRQVDGEANASVGSSRTHLKAREWSAEKTGERQFQVRRRASPLPLPAAAVGARPRAEPKLVRIALAKRAVASPHVALQSCGHAA